MHGGCQRTTKSANADKDTAEPLSLEREGEKELSAAIRRKGGRGQLIIPTISPCVCVCVYVSNSHDQAPSPLLFLTSVLARAFPCKSTYAHVRCDYLWISLQRTAAHGGVTRTKVTSKEKQHALLLLFLYFLFHHLSKRHVTHVACVSVCNLHLCEQQKKKRTKRPSAASCVFVCLCVCPLSALIDPSSLPITACFFFFWLLLLLYAKSPLSCCKVGPLTGIDSPRHRAPNKIISVVYTCIKSAPLHRRDFYACLLSPSSIFPHQSRTPTK
jgi:hypothetical protein